MDPSDELWCVEHVKFQPALIGNQSRIIGEWCVECEDKSFGWVWVRFCAMLRVHWADWFYAWKSYLGLNWKEESTCRRVLYWVKWKTEVHEVVLMSNSKSAEQSYESITVIIWVDCACGVECSFRCTRSRRWDAMGLVRWGMAWWCLGFVLRKPISCKRYSTRPHFWDHLYMCW